MFRHWLLILRRKARSGRSPVDKTLTQWPYAAMSAHALSLSLPSPLSPSLSLSFYQSGGNKPGQNVVERHYYYPSTITTLTFTTLSIIGVLTTLCSRAHVYGLILLRNRLMNASRRGLRPTSHTRPAIPDLRLSMKM